MHIYIYIMYAFLFAYKQDFEHNNNEELDYL